MPPYTKGTAKDIDGKILVSKKNKVFTRQGFKVGDIVRLDGFNKILAVITDVHLKFKSCSVQLLQREVENNYNVGEVIAVKFTKITSYDQIIDKMLSEMDFG